MRVQVLDEATADLAGGFRFYERQADGLGDYFLDSLWSESESNETGEFGDANPERRAAPEIPEKSENKAVRTEYSETEGEKKRFREENPFRSGAQSRTKTQTRNLLCTYRSPRIKPGFGTTAVGASIRPSAALQV